MDFKLKLASCFLVIACALVAAACGDGEPGENEDAEATASVEATASTEATPAQESSPDPDAPPTIAQPAPTVEGNRYTFPDKGYSVEKPAGWGARPNNLFVVSSELFPSDSFIAPDSEVVDNIRPSVSISCLIPGENERTSADAATAWGAFVNQLARQEVPSTRTAVSGVDAFAFNYAQQQHASAPIFADRTDVVFVSGGCRWLITLLTPEGRRESYIERFEKLLESFKVFR